MLFHLVRKEILDSLLNRRFVAIAVFSMVLMPPSAFINYEYYEARKADLIVNSQSIRRKIHLPRI